MCAGPSWVSSGDALWRLVRQRGVQWCWHGLVLWTMRLEGCWLLLGLCLAGLRVWCGGMEVWLSPSGGVLYWKTRWPGLRPAVPSRWGYVSQSEPVGAAVELFCKRS